MAKQLLLLFACVLIAASALAQANVDVPKNKQPAPQTPQANVDMSKTDTASGLADAGKTFTVSEQWLRARNDQLLAVLKSALDAASVNNELKYEKEHKLDAAQILERRIFVVANVKTKQP